MRCQVSRHRLRQWPIIDQVACDRVERAALLCSKNSALSAHLLLIIPTLGDKCGGTRWPSSSDMRIDSLLFISHAKGDVV